MTWRESINEYGVVTNCVKRSSNIGMDMGFLRSTTRHSLQSTITVYPYFKLQCAIRRFGWREWKLGEVAFDIKQREIAFLTGWQAGSALSCFSNWHRKVGRRYLTAAPRRGVDAAAAAAVNRICCELWPQPDRISMAISTNKVALAFKKFKVILTFILFLDYIQM